jgi:hypothetical protein
LTEALRLYDSGLWVVPCDGKRPVWTRWQTVRRSREELAAALGNCRLLNIGVVLGQCPWIDVETDTPEGEANLRAIFGSDLPRTPVWRSKRGEHRAFKRPPGLPNKAVVKVDGIEFRIGGGKKGALSIVPPSVHPDGPRYEWLPGLSLHEVEPAELPGPVVERLRAPGQAKAKGTQDGAAADGDLPEPGRNDALFKLACKLYREGHPAEDVQSMVLAVNLARCKPPLEAEEVRELVGKAGKQVEADKARTWPYSVQAGRIVRQRQTQDGAVFDPLCNFSAWIVEEVTVDDGAEPSVTLALEGQLADGRPLPRVEVPAGEYGGMNWVTAVWGVGPVVYAGLGAKDHLRAAIQVMSPDVPRSTVFGHTGWRQVGAEWLYLHAGGAIGPSGKMDSVRVALPEALSLYDLPDPPDGEELKAAVRASLGVLDLGPRRVTASVLGTVYRAVLGTADFAPHLAGPTGVGKTELGALAQQHWGARLDSRHLPGSWSSTANSLEALAFAAADALLAVDDFCPGGTTADVARVHREADRLLRAQGNRAGRGRCRTDGTVRPARPPRGTILSTGEDVPRGQSLRSRLWIVELAKGDLDWGRLTACQRDAGAGLYSQAMAAYLQWLASRIGTIRRELPAEVARLRDELRAKGQHARTPGIAADLLIGWQTWLQFAVEVGATGGCGRDLLMGQVREALLAAAAAQEEHVQAAEPAGLFVRLVAAALASGRAHLAAPDGTHPPNSGARWGWREDPGSVGLWKPQGRCIGWVDGMDGPLQGERTAQAVYLEPDSAYATAQGLAQEQGESLCVSGQTLWKRLHQRNLLASRDERRQRNTVRRVIEGVKREVLHLHGDALISPTQETVHSVH